MVQSAGTDRAVGPVEDPAGEVGGVAHHARHVLRQLGVEVGAAAPQPEPPPAAGALLRPRLLQVGSVTHHRGTALLSTAPAAPRWCPPPRAGRSAPCSRRR